MSAMALVLKHFQTEGGCLSYALLDPKNKSAVLIDPIVDLIDDYDAFFSEHDTKPAFILETHTHADHYSSSHLIAEKFGATIAMGKHTQSQRVQRRLNDGEVLSVGPVLKLRTLETPGHTPDSVCFLVENLYGIAVPGLADSPAKHSAVFTGDTLLIGGSGRTDFPGSSPEAQHESIYNVLGKLPGETWVYPGHDYSGLLFSTLEAEKRLNPHFNFNSQAEFVRHKKAELLDCAGVVQEIVQFNLNAQPSFTPSGGAATQCFSSAPLPESTSTKTYTVESLLQAPVGTTNGPVLFIDIREPEEYRFGHIPGAVNVPMSQVALYLPLFEQAAEVCISCQTGRRSKLLLKTLARLGLKNFSEFSPGFSGWMRAGQKIKR